MTRHARFQDGDGDPLQSDPLGIDFQKWMAFFTAYCAATTGDLPNYVQLMVAVSSLWL